MFEIYRFWIIIIYLSAQMQGFTCDQSLFSFIMVPPSLHYFTFVPMTPTTPETIPPTSFQQSHSLFYTSSFLDSGWQNDNTNLVSTSSALNNTTISYKSDSNNSLGINFSNQTQQQPTSLTALPLEEHSLLQQRVMHSCNVSKSKQSTVKTNSEDVQYNPSGQRKLRKSMKYQENENRNIIPNEINQIFSFIQKQAKSGRLVERVMSKISHPPEYTTKRFYLYQSLLKGRLGHYTNQKSLRVVGELYEPKCESWNEQEQRFYNKICRILIRHFLHQDSVFIILTSRRMRQNKKYDHLRARHQLKQAVLNALKG